MNIKILGTRGEVKESAPKHSKHSGILINNQLLLDLGEKEFLKYGPKAVVITHLHPDHAFFVREKEKLITNIPIYAPQKHSRVKITQLKPLNSIKLQGFLITPIPTYHSKLVKSQGYLVEKGQKRIFYTGDMIWVEKKYHNLFKKLNLVITEASFIDKGGLVRRDRKSGVIYGHTGIPNLIRLFAHFTPKIIFVHFGGWFYKSSAKARQKLSKLGRQYNIQVQAGYDGLTIRL